MFYLILLVMVVSWVVGVITHVLGGWIHLLLVAALAVVLIRVIQGRQPPGGPGVGGV